MVQDGPISEARVLLDPNLLSDDGTTALAGWSVSPDGKWLAWGVSQGGTDWQEWRIRNVDSIQDLPGTTQWLRYSGVSWKRDNTGYYYSRYDAPPRGRSSPAETSFTRCTSTGSATNR
jgi:prolyl oligopeptidase